MLDSWMCAHWLKANSPAVRSAARSSKHAKWEQRVKMQTQSCLHRLHEYETITRWENYLISKLLQFFYIDFFWLFISTAKTINHVFFGSAQTVKCMKSNEVFQLCITVNKWSQKCGEIDFNLEYYWSNLSVYIIMNF